MLRFISFGSGSSGNCYFLFTETDGLLIDAGIGLRTLKKHFGDYGLSLSQVHNILITHDHADHIKSVGSLSHEYFLSVHTTRLVHRGITRNYCVSHKIDAGLMHFIEHGETVQIGEFCVTAFAVPHDSTDCIGYSIECQGVRFCIMTDVGEVTETMRPFIKSANYLVIEANHDMEMLMQGPYPQHLKERVSSKQGHLSNKSCAEAIVNNMSEDLRRVWLCHLSEENNHPELARKTVESVMRSYGVICGKDIILDVLKRKVPSEIIDLV